MKPQSQIAVGIEGIIKSVQLVDAKTGRVVRELKAFKNVITNAGLDAIGNGTDISNLTNYLGVGTDNTAPSVSQTALVSQLGARSNSNGGFGDSSASGPSFAYWERTRTREIAAGASTGNLTELGFFSAGTSGTMWCRQLFLDDLGSPTTITKLADQILRVIYSWRVYPSTTISTDVVNIDGTDTDCDARAMSINSDFDWGGLGILTRLGSWDANPISKLAHETNVFPTPTGGNFSGSAVQANSSSYSSYVGGTYYRDLSIVWNPSTANFATGIGAIRIGFQGNGSAAIGTTFDPKVPKDNLHRFTYTVRISWARV